VLGPTNAGHGQLQASEEEAVQRCAAGSRYVAVALARLGRKTVSAVEAGLLQVAGARRCPDAQPDVPRCQQGLTQQYSEGTK
jgi:hypothetical protein